MKVDLLEAFLRVFGFSSSVKIPKLLNNYEFNLHKVVSAMMLQKPYIPTVNTTVINCYS